METQKWISEMKEVDVEEEPKMMEVTIAFRMRLPVSQNFVSNVQNDRVLLFHTERKLRDLMSRYDLRSMHHLKNDGSWSLNTYVDEVEEDE